MLAEILCRVGVCPVRISSGGRNRRERNGSGLGHREIDIMILPFAKLGTLVLRTLSKPLANKLKQQATHHPRFREIIINFAQLVQQATSVAARHADRSAAPLSGKDTVLGLVQHANHRFQVNLQRRIYSHATDVEIRPLNEEKAVQAASDFLGETFIFSVGGAVVIFEVSRGARSEARKEEARKTELEDLRKRDQIVAEELDMLRARLDELERFQKRGLTSWIPGLGYEHEKGTPRTVFPPPPSEAAQTTA